MSEFAPEYTQREKMNYFIRVCVVSIPMAFIMLYWFTPWFHSLVVASNCVKFGDVKGLNFVLYGIFAGLPLLAGILLSIILGPRLVKSIKLGQHPLPGEKVLSKTKYIYGREVKIRAYIMLTLIGCTLLVAVQGVFWAGDLVYLLQYSSINAC